MNTSSKSLWLGSTAFVLLLAVAGYAWKGSPSLAMKPVPAEVATASAPEASAMPDGMDPAQFDQLIEKLRQRMANEPDNAEGWSMLARSYMVVGKADEALAAFDKAITLAPKDASLAADHANVLARRDGLGPGSRALAQVERAIALDPKQPKALALAGIAAFERKDFAVAVRHWQTALDVMPDHPYASQMRDGIAQAKEAMGQGAGPQAAAPAAPSAQGAQAAQSAPSARAPAAGTADFVEGRVTLAPSLAAKAAPDDTIFVFARAADGPRMPLAIIRKQVKDLPFDFRLDDSMAMSPQSKLSSAPKVIVGARVSKGGGATAQPGDLQGLTAAVAVGSKGVEVVIGEEVGATGR